MLLMDKIDKIMTGGGAADIYGLIDSVFIILSD
jgi:hypothetical protein